MIIPGGYAREDDCACGLNGVKNDLIPDYIIGLNVKDACCIHDWMYGVGRTENDRRNADKVFLQNLLFLIDEAGGSWGLRAARKAMAYKYYLGVLMFGGALFHRRRASYALEK
jgi:hypothetical protein